MTIKRTNYIWHLWTPKYHYLRDAREGTTAAKLYYMHGRWNISIKHHDNHDVLMRLCEERIVDITTKILEGT